MLPTLKHLTFFGFLAFTLVSADDPAGILAFPKDRHDSKQTNDTDIAIKQLLGDTKVYSYVSPYQGVAFWLAPMTQDQQDKIKAMPGVSQPHIVNIDQLLSCFRSVVLPTIPRTLLKMRPLFQTTIQSPIRKTRLVGSKRGKGS